MAGFETKNNKKKINEERTSTYQVRGMVFGDALLALYRAVHSLGMEIEEISTTHATPFGVINIPFTHYQTASGLDIPMGTYLVKGLGKVSSGTGRDEDGDEVAIPELTVTVTFETGANEEDWVKLKGLLEEEKKTYTSIFRGHALRINTPRDLIVPHYIDTTVDSGLILNSETMKELEITLFQPITHAKELQALGLRAQRGILLHGPYGTGKSLVAYEAAKRAVAAGRTFCLCKSDMIEVALQVARFLEPSLVFLEDMDELYSRGAGTSSLRNLMSGVHNKKGNDVITVLTTNFLERVENMDRSLLRPERIDAIVEIDPPNQDTMRSLLDQQAKDWLKEDDDWVKACKIMADDKVTPAILVEMVNRAKAAAFLSNNKIITEELLAEQFGKMQRQIKLSTPEEPQQATTATRLADALKDVAYRGRTM